MPAYVGKSKKKIAYIKYKIWKIIQGWKKKLLSRVGKEILTKAVAQATPNFLMSCFYLANGFFHELSAMTVKYWCNQQEKQKKIH